MDAAIGNVHKQFWAEPNKVRKEFLPHCALWYLRESLKDLPDAKSRDIVRKKWAQIYGISVAELRRQLARAQ